MPKKTAVQLQREINEVLAKKHERRSATSHARKTRGTIGSSRPAPAPPHDRRLRSEGAADTRRLVAEMEALPDYRGWSFSYEYPGYFSYGHPDLPYRVAFTPDWEGDQELPIQVTDDEGRFFEEHSPVLPLPREGRTGEKLLRLVRPTLDTLLALPRDR